MPDGDWLGRSCSAEKLDHRCLGTAMRNRKEEKRQLRRFERGARFTVGASKERGVEQESTNNDAG